MLLIHDLIDLLRVYVQESEKLPRQKALDFLVAGGDALQLKGLIVVRSDAVGGDERVVFRAELDLMRLFIVMADPFAAAVAPHIAIRAAVRDRACAWLSHLVARREEHRLAALAVLKERSPRVRRVF